MKRIKSFLILTILVLIITDYNVYSFCWSSRASCFDSGCSVIARGLNMRMKDFSTLVYLIIT